MAKYRVHMARVTWLTANVEAEDEDQALEEAYEVVPSFTANESGWGSFGKWSADADEWVPVDEFWLTWNGGYDAVSNGPVVELVDDPEADCE